MLRAAAAGAGGAAPGGGAGGAAPPAALPSAFLALNSKYRRAGALGAAGSAPAECLRAQLRELGGDAARPGPPPPPPQLASYGNAQFFVAARVAWRRPRAFWQSAHRFVAGAALGLDAAPPAGCDGLERGDGRPVANAACAVFERTWHALFCEPCALPRRRDDVRLPAAIRIK